MNSIELDFAIKSFDMKYYKQLHANVEAYRQDFVRRFTPGRIRSMHIDNYIQGKGIKDDNFCYELERKLALYGNITGSTAHKFGIFFNRDSNDYIITKQWQRDSLGESFHALREDLAKLIEAAREEDMEFIRISPFAPMFKGKILATYFPEKYLSIFSEDHLDHYVHRLELDHKLPKDADIFDKRRILVRYKNEHPIMATWSLHCFAYFLYVVYPGDPRKCGIPDDELCNYLEQIELINGDFCSLEDNVSIANNGKPDYEVQSHKRKILGERGEYVVMQYESDVLKLAGQQKEPKQVSLTDDSLGYDIVSYKSDGTEKFIEVKATNSQPKDFRFFFTANELASALKYKTAYHVYIVFNPNKARPRIYDIGNPFIEDGKVKLIPVSYKIHLQKL